MFLVERLPASPIRTDLMPRQLFGGAGDIIRAGLVSAAPEPARAVPRRASAQLDFAFAEAAVRRAG